MWEVASGLKGGKGQYEVEQLPETAQQQGTEATQAHPWGEEGRWLAQPARTGSPGITREPCGSEACENSLLPTQRILPPSPKR